MEKFKINNELITKECSQRNHLLWLAFGLGEKI